MSKAKELATNVISQMEEIQRQVMNNNSLSGFTKDWQSGFNHAMIELRNRLNDAVLSEPEPDLKGWIEVTDNCDELVLVNLSKVEKIVNLCRETIPRCKTQIVINGDKWEAVECQESYDSIKQKIKEAS